MSIELNTGKTATSIASPMDTMSDGGEVAKAKTSPILGGESLKVSSGATTDLEKLVMQLKAETDDVSMSLAQRRISILSTVLDSMSDRISAAERNSLIEIESLNGEKSELESELAGYQSDKTATEGRIAILDAEIEALEKAVEQAVQDGADHRERVAELKKQRAEEEAKLEQLNVAIESANSKISGIDVKISECTATIAKTTLNEVASAMRAAANAKSSSSSVEELSNESNAERTKKEEKMEATDVAKIISEALDEIDDQIRAALDEAQMKVHG